MTALSFPIAWDNRWEFPTEFSDNVWVRIIFDGRHEGREGNIFSEFFGARRIRDEVTRQRCVVRRENVHYRGIDGEELAGGVGAIEDFGEESRAGAVYRIATRHAECDGFVAGHAIHQFNATVVGVDGGLEISVGQAWTGMICGMGLERESLFEPGLELRVFGID